MADDQNPFRPTKLDLFRPPPYKPIPEPEWATYIPSRGYGDTSTASYNGAWKIHPSRGAARNAMSQKTSYARALYHLEEIDGVKTWVQVEKHQGHLGQ